jgi:hypothetical protein
VSYKFWCCFLVWGLWVLKEECEEVCTDNTCASALPFVAVSLSLQSRPTTHMYPPADGCCVRLCPCALSVLQLL